MDGYNLPYFKGVPRQRGRGFGALARTVARTTFSILKKYVLPAAKKIGQDVIKSAILEIGCVLLGQTSIKKAVKKTAKSTIQKQVGGGMKKRKNNRQNKRHTEQSNEFVLSRISIKRFLSSLPSKCNGFVHQFSSRQN